MRRLPFAEFPGDDVTLLGEIAVDAPKCLVYTNYLDVDESIGNQLINSLYVEKRVTHPAVKLKALPAAATLAVPTGEDFIPVVGADVLRDQILPSWNEETLEQRLKSCWAEVDVPDEAVLIARYGLRTWGHWLGELLPKIVCVENAFPGRFKYVLPQSVLAEMQFSTLRQSLLAYGIGPQRLFLARPQKLYHFAQLHVVSPVWTVEDGIHPEAARLMRTQLSDASNGRMTGEKVALLRRETKTRQIVNIDELATFLEDRGWTIVDIGNLSFSEQIRVFSAATCVVSVLGSGLTGLIFSPPHVKVLTLAPSNWLDLFFFRLMQERDAQLADIRGLSQAAASSDAWAAPFSIEIAAVQSGLDALGISTEPDPKNKLHNSHQWEFEYAPHFLLRRAYEAYAAGNLDLAEVTLRRAIVTAPHESGLHGALIEMLIEARRDHETEIAANHAQNIEDLEGFVTLMRSIQEFSAKRQATDSALAQLRREAACAPNENGVFAHIGHKFLTAGEPEIAALAFSRSGYLEPFDSDVHRSLIHCLLRLGRAKEALAAALKVVGLNRSDIANYRLVGDTCAQAGLLDEALTAYKKVAEVDGADPSLLIRMSKLYEARGDIRDSIALLEKVIYVNPGDAGIHIQKGHLLARLGELEPAVLAFQKGLSYQPTNAGVYEALCWAFSALNRSNDAVEAARSAVALAPDEPRFGQLLAQMLAATGNAKSSG